MSEQKRSRRWIVLATAPLRGTHLNSPRLWVNQINSPLAAQPLGLRHGVDRSGDNYPLTAEAQIKSEADVEPNAINLGAARVGSTFIRCGEAISQKPAREISRRRSSLLETGSAARPGDCRWRHEA